jgi:hypothetical protein
LTGRAETGEVLDAGFELFDFVLEFLRLWIVDSGELVFEALKPRFLAFFVNIGFADILAFVDLVEVRLREVSNFECLIDFGGVDGGDTLSINALVFE